MKIYVAENQSVFDIAIQYLGSALAAIDVALANNISLTDVLQPGQQLVIPDSGFRNDEVANYFTGRNQGIATNFLDITVNEIDYLIPGMFPYSL
jgi:hypothetical protein